MRASDARRHSQSVPFVSRSLAGVTAQVLTVAERKGAAVLISSSSPKEEGGKEGPLASSFANSLFRDEDEDEVEVVVVRTLVGLSSLLFVNYAVISLSLSLCSVSSILSDRREWMEWREMEGLTRPTHPSFSSGNDRVHLCLETVLKLSRKNVYALL